MTPEFSRHVPPDRRSGVTIWHQIAEQLAAEIRDDRFPEGRLPSESELSARFGVNRHTLRQAVQSLQEQGLLRIERGRGMFAQRDFLDYALSRRTRFSQNLQGQGLLPAQHLLAAQEEPATERVARELGLAPREPVLRIENLNEASGQPVSLMTAWYPCSRFDGLLAMLQEGTSTSEMLRRLGVHDYVRAETRVTTQMPTKETAHLLQQPITRPLLCVSSVDVDTLGQRIKYGETLFSGDRVQLTITMGDTL